MAYACKIDRLIWMREKYHGVLLKDTNNPFWRSVILAYKSWFKIINNDLNITVVFQPIRGNTRINIPFNSNLYTNNKLFLDRYANDGSFLYKSQLEAKPTRPIIFTTNCALRKAIPNEWKVLLRPSINDHNIDIPPVIACLAN